MQILHLQVKDTTLVCFTSQHGSCWAHNLNFEIFSLTVLETLFTLLVPERPWEGDDKLFLSEKTPEYWNDVVWSSPVPKIIGDSCFKSEFYSCWIWSSKFIYKGAFPDISIFFGQKEADQSANCSIPCWLEHQHTICAVFSENI